jgi:hypothetical protein
MNQSVGLSHLARVPTTVKVILDLLFASVARTQGNNLRTYFRHKRPQFCVAKKDLTVIIDVEKDMSSDRGAQCCHRVQLRVPAVLTLDVRSPSVVRMISTSIASLLGKW